MPPLEAYKRSLSYSYAPGLYPASQALLHAPQLVTRVLLHSQLEEGEGKRALLSLCQQHHVRTEVADRALRRISGKDNCYAAAVFNKDFKKPLPGHNHLLLYQPMDAGNLGTIMRTALGFHYHHLILVRPCTDPYEPQTIRASMGAVFSLNLTEVSSIEEYRQMFPNQQLFPFMLEGSQALSQAVAQKKPPFTLLFGNEGSGLPPETASLGQPVRIEQSEAIDSLNLAVAAAVGMYAFSPGENREPECS